MKTNIEINDELIESSINSHVGDTNDESTRSVLRSKIKNCIHPKLVVICDSSNNKPENIERNELIAEIAHKDSGDIVRKYSLTPSQQQMVSLCPLGRTVFGCIP